MLTMCRRCEKPMAVLMADIDHFPESNDAHSCGRRRACRVGNALRSDAGALLGLWYAGSAARNFCCAHASCRDTAKAMRQAARLRAAPIKTAPVRRTAAA